MTPRIRAHRILSNMNRFKYVESEYLKALFERNNLALLEENIGFYENHDGSIEEGILISDKEISILSTSKTQTFFYDEIDMILPLDNKEDMKKIVIVLNSGDKVFVPVYGENGRFKDIFEFSRFLNRVYEDIKGCC